MKYAITRNNLFFTGKGEETWKSPKNWSSNKEDAYTAQAASIQGLMCLHPDFFNGSKMVKVN